LEAPEPREAETPLAAGVPKRPKATRGRRSKSSAPANDASARAIGEFAALLRRMLVIERVRSVHEVAAALGMSYSTFYARLHGRVPFRPEEITRVLRIVPDMRLLDCLLLDTGFLAVARPEKAEFVEMREAVGMTIRSAEAILATLRIINEALFTAEFGQSFRSEVEQKILEAQRGLAALGLALPRFGLAGAGQRD
jgi:hypothetical protein